jgi:hypothetical protein
MFKKTYAENIIKNANLAQEIEYIWRLEEVIIKPTAI